ncbi:hypothetical protein ILYODFUR_029909 [Ilyodon furcidens]|uniref:Uncharacterized protein n=1 Tax=Ilyodon furcidens TaxID=33524 RepID=A0ABV0VIR1_9TELE
MKNVQIINISVQTLTSDVTGSPQLPRFLAVPEADPILLDILEVCQRVDQETSHQPVKTQDSSLVVLSKDLASPAMGAALENVFSPPPVSSSGLTNQTSSSNELMEIFSPPLTDPLTPNHIASVSQPASPAESPQQTLSAAQILSMFPTQPPGGSPYISPPLSPSAMPWGQQGLVGNQLTGSWPSTPGVPAPLDITAPPAVVLPQPGFMMMMSPAAPPSLNEYPLNSICMLNGTTGAPGAPGLDNNPFL